MELTEEQKQKACELAALGKPLREIREGIDLDHKAFWKARLQDPKFSARFEQARQEGLEELADSLINMVDEYQDVQKARVKSENIRWLLSKRKAGTYGDKLDITVNQTVDIRGALEDAKKRAQLPDRYQDNSIEAEHREITNELPNHASDSQSLADQKCSQEEIDLLS